MSVDIRSSDRRRYMNELQAREKEIAAGLLKASQPASPKALQENEKRIRREIANSNERRRMQCINAGFSSLRALIPQLEGEKLSKAAILQHTTEYITSMEKEKSRLQSQVEHSKRLLSELGQDRAVTEAYVSNTPPPSKRKKRDTESSDEGVGSLSDASDDGGSELQHENVTLRHQLEAERQRCHALEERNRLLETQLLTVLQGAQHIGTLNQEVRPVSLAQQHESLYNREVVEVIASREVLVSSPHADSYQPPRPLSPTPERGMAMEMVTPMDVSTTPRSVPCDSPHYPMKGGPPSPAMKMETAFGRDTGTPGMLSQHGSSAEPMAVVVTANTTTAAAAASSSSTITPTDQHSYHHHHNYCHRDHPRRRHRQQAQLEQQREEELQRQQQQEKEMALSTPAVYLRKHNNQNLENLVEAIRQIEGDRILCDERKVYEEEDHKVCDKRQSVASVEEMERETSSVSDQDELKSEASGRDSPPMHQHHHHHHHHHHHQQQQQQQQQQTSIINSHQLTTSLLTRSAPSSCISNSSSNFSEKYPIATHLLHRPLHPSFYRPGVIVHKQ